MARHTHSLALVRALRKKFCALKDERSAVLQQQSSTSSPTRSSQKLEHCGARAWCAIVVRVFPGQLPRDEPRVNASFEELLAHPAVAPIIDERSDLREQECSQNYSAATRDYAAAPTEEHRRRRSEWAAAHCADAASPGFARSREEWYRGLRASLRGRSYVDLSFEDVTRDLAGSVRRVARTFAPAV